MDAPLADAQIAIVRWVLQGLRDGQPCLTSQQLDQLARDIILPLRLKEY